MPTISIRSSSPVTLTPEGDQAWRTQNLAPQLRDVLSHLRQAERRELLVRELMLLVNDSSSITEDLSELARNGWVVIALARQLAESSEEGAGPESIEAPEEALNSLLERRAPTPLDVPGPPPTSSTEVASTAEVAAPARGTVVPKSAIEVRSDPERDRRLLEAMGILKGPEEASVPAPSAPPPETRPKTKDIHGVPLSSRDLLKRLGKLPED